MVSAQTRKLIVDAIDVKAADSVGCWDSPLHWSASAKAIEDVIASAGAAMKYEHLTTLIRAAAMAQHKALEPQPDLPLQQEQSA